MSSDPPSKNIMPSGPPSKTIVPVADVGPDVNSYYYTNGSILSTVRSEFIKLCKNASLFSGDHYSAWVCLTKDLDEAGRPMEVMLERHSSCWDHPLELDPPPPRSPVTGSGLRKQNLIKHMWTFNHSEQPYIRLDRVPQVVEEKFQTTVPMPPPSLEELIAMSTEEAMALAGKRKRVPFTFLLTSVSVIPKPHPSTLSSENRG